MLLYTVSHGINYFLLLFSCDATLIRWQYMSKTTIKFHRITRVITFYMFSHFMNCFVLHDLYCLNVVIYKTLTKMCLLNKCKC